MLTEVCHVVNCPIASRTFVLNSHIKQNKTKIGLTKIVGSPIRDTIELPFDLKIIRL